MEMKQMNLYGKEINFPEKIYVVPKPQMIWHPQELTRVDVYGKLEVQKLEEFSKVVKQPEFIKAVSDLIKMYNDHEAMQLSMVIIEALSKDKHKQEIAKKNIETLKDTRQLLENIVKTLSE